MAGHWLLAGGHRYGSRSGFATKWEAKHFADACEVAERAAAAAVVKDSAVAGERVVTVGEWWERWFPVQDLAPATLEAYAQQYRHHIAPRFADVPVGQVTGLDLAGFSRALREQDLSRSSMTVIMSVLCDLLGDAAAEGVITAAPKMPGRGRTRHAPVSVRPGRVLGWRAVAGGAVVESVRGAVPVLPPARFPGPLAEPAVPISRQRALHGFCRQAGFVEGQGVRILLPR